MSILESVCTTLEITHRDRPILWGALFARINECAKGLAATKVYRDLYWNDILTLSNLLFKLYPTDHDDDVSRVREILDCYPALEEFRRRPDAPADLALPPLSVAAE